MILLLVFLIGISVGSFLNVVVDRLPRQESVLKGRSYCEGCRKVLKWYDLIPLLSFIQLKGKCRYCSVSLSLYYPLVELVTGIMFIFVYWWFGQYQIFNLFIFSSFIVVFFTDLKYRIIPDKILYPAILISFFILITSNEPGVFINYLLSAIGAFIFFLLIFLITKGKGMGFGDVKLVFLMGLFLGFPKIIVALYLSFLIGAAVSMALVILKRKKFKGGTIPFGPFLVIGTFVSFFFSDFLIKIFLYNLF